MPDLAGAAAERAFYAAPGRLTSLTGTSDLPAGPQTVASVATLVHGLVLHEAFAADYGVTVPADRRAEMQLRSAADMLSRIRALDSRPLASARPPERRLIGYCRHIAVLSTALLRHAAIPARARCGFSASFEPGRWIDHWIVEHWDPASRRWVRSDTQFDDLLERKLGLSFDPFDVPAGQFLTGGEAWRLCRAGRVDPAHFGIARWWGAWFVRNNVVRDLAALNKIEMLPWDSWGLMDRHSTLGHGPADDLVDQVAAATSPGAWPAARRLYASEPRLRVPEPFAAP
jgi:hypothetical protein